jgi:phosphohistidine phosphatase
LIVVRHAKSSWDSPTNSDHDRPLNDRGQTEAPELARRLIARGWHPAIVLSSDARRTRETYDRMATQWTEPVEVHFLQSLYLADYADVLSVINLVPDQLSPLMLLGHNPGWEQLASRLSGEDITLKTATAALLVGEGATWYDALCAAGTWRLTELLRGK